MSTQTQLSIHTFETHAIRTLAINNEPWFIAKDLCDVLNISNVSDALLKLDDDEKMVFDNTLGLTESIARQVQEVNLVNESGMYTLMLRSRNAVKKGTIQHRFRKWVTAEVLPQIRKTGQYRVQQLALPEPEPTYTLETTRKGVSDLVWLIFSHEQMRGLLEQLYPALEAIGSRYAAAVYGNYTEYKRHYRECLPIIKGLLNQLKADNPIEWERLSARLLEPNTKRLAAR